MKKYLFIFGVFLASLIFIGSNLQRNVEINEQLDGFENIKQLSYEMSTILEEQKHMLHHLNLKYRDKLFDFNEKVNNLAFNFVSTLQATDDKKLIKIAQSIENKVNTLDAFYKKLETQDAIDLGNVEIELETYDISDDVDLVILHSLKNIYKLNAEVSSIIKVLVGSSVFLLIFGVIVYIREILYAKEVDKLKNELQQFVDVLNDTSIVSKADINGKITFVNEQFCAVSGYTMSELVGHPHNIIRHPDMPSAVFKEMWETIRSGKTFRGIIKNRKKNGEAYYVDSAIVPILDIHKEIVEYLAVRYDVTEIILSRDKALLAEKSKDEFLSNMSHELRTPLNSIVGFSDILKRLIKDEKHLKYLKNITDSSASLLQIINDILDLSKLNSGSFSLDYHEFEVYTSLESLLSRFDVNALASGIEIKTDLDKSLKTNLIGDWLRISQIITNFMSNAIKFTPQGKHIEVQASYVNGKLCVSVKDSGIGMSKEVQEKIFKPFEQADSSTTREYGGTGLGLSIVVSLIEKMDGTLSLESQEGAGSEFKVEIPLQARAHKRQEESMIEDIHEYAPLSGHLLIAEDNKTNQILIKVLVEEFGLSCTLVQNGIEAVNTFSKDKFDLILMDENMPKLNGVDAMKRIRTMQGGSLPIVALTANAMKGDREKFLEDGMDEFVAKPIDSDDLYRVLKSFLSDNNEK